MIIIFFSSLVCWDWRGSWERAWLSPVSRVSDYSWVNRCSTSPPNPPSPSRAWRSAPCHDAHQSCRRKRRRHIEWKNTVCVCMYVCHNAWQLCRQKRRRRIKGKTSCVCVFMRVCRDPCQLCRQKRHRHTEWKNTVCICLHVWRCVSQEIVCKNRTTGK